MMTNCGCREISHDPIEFKIEEEHPLVHINCGPLLPNTRGDDFDRLQKKIICDFQKVIKLLECGILPDIEIILEEISLIFMNGCGYNVAKKMYSTDIEDDYFLRHDNFLSEFATLEEKNLVLLNLGIYEKIRDMITKNDLTSGLDTKIGYVVHIGKYYCGFATSEHYSQWIETNDNSLIIGSWIAGDYVPTDYTIIFNPSGGENITYDGETLPNQKTVKEGFPFTFPLPSHNDSNQVFAGWYSNQLYEGDQYNVGDKFVPTQSMVFYAKWERPVRTITFHLENGENPIVVNCNKGDKIIFTSSGITIKYKNTKLQVAIRPTYEGHTFSVWLMRTAISESDIFDGDSFDIVDDNLEVYAYWTTDMYTVTFNSNNGSQQQVEVEYGTNVSELTFPNFTRTGYIIKGWSTNQSALESLPDTITGNITFYVIWLLAYRYKLTTSIPNTISEWSYSSTLLITFGELDGWNNWKDQSNQYIIVPKQIGKSDIIDYIDILDLFNLSIIEDFEITNINENIIIIKLIGFSPLDDSDYNAKLIIKI